MKRMHSPRNRYGLVVGSLAALAALTGTAAHAQSTNLALNKPAQQISLSPWSTGANDAQGGVDGKKNGSFGFHTNPENQAWWKVDLQQLCNLSEIHVYNRMDGEAARAYSLLIFVSSDNTNWQQVHNQNGAPFGGVTDGKPLKVNVSGRQARYVKLQLATTSYLHLDEVEVYGTPAGAMPTPTLTLRTSKTTYAPNEEIVVEFTGMPGNQSDWVSLAKQGGPAEQYESGRYSYTNGERNGSRKFTGLPAGQYEARGYFNWSTGGYTIQARAAFTVTAETTPPPVTAGNFSGYWTTDSDVVAFVQNGSRVQGYYAYAFEIWWGSIQGEVRGNTLIGTFEDTFGSGSVRFERSADGKSCAGHWWDENGDYGGTWNLQYHSPLR